MVSEQRSLLDLVEVVGGGTPSRSEPRYWGGDIPWATVKDLSETPIRYTAERITKEGLENSAANLVPAGAIVLATRIAPGRAALTKFDLAINQDLKGLLPRDGVDAGYLLHFIRANALGIARMGAGSTVQGITLETLARVRIFLPDLTGQGRIAAMLDKADSLQRKQGERIRLLDEFLRSAFLEMFGDPVTNEKTWQTARLGEVAFFVGGGTPRRAMPEFYTGSIPWASSKDITSEDLLDTQEHVTAVAVEQSATRVVPAGSILVVVKSKVLLHRLPVAIARVPVCFSQDIKAIAPSDDRVSSSYLARHLRVGQKSLLNKARGANTEGLTLDHLRDYRVMIPPADLVERWDRVETTIRALRTSFSDHLSSAKSLFYSLSQVAFGEGRTQAPRAIVLPLKIEA